MLPRPVFAVQKVLGKLFDEINEEIIDAIVEEIKSWFDDDDKGDKDDHAKKKPSKAQAESLKTGMDELEQRGDDGEDVADLARSGDK